MTTAYGRPAIPDTDGAQTQPPALSHSRRRREAQRRRAGDDFTETLVQPPFVMRRPDIS